MTAVNANIAAPRLLLVAGGAVKQIAEVLGKFGLSRPLIVSDPFMVKLGLIDRCLAPLAAAGIKADVFSDTIPEPTDTVIEAGAAAFAKAPYDCLIGFGGGSPIDTAKAIAVLASGGGKQITPAHHQSVVIGPSRERTNSVIESCARTNPRP